MPDRPLVVQRVSDVRTAINQLLEGGSNLASKYSFSKWVEAVRNMPPSRRIRMIREGVQATLLPGVARYYGISQTRISKLIGISSTTVNRKIKSGGKLGPMESERLARIALIEAEAEDVFTSPDLAKNWMLQPNLALGEPPLSLLDTDIGANEVRKVLVAMAYGGAT